ncbi:MAG: superoxide dismutase [Alphaproteobacteria bacterium]|nr:superoxide dismutase [Alphaproteobacteria bacterium]
MVFELPKLPFGLDELEPYISKKTLEFHYGKHHQTYVTNLNNLIKETDLANADLETIIKETAGKADKSAIFNNAAQVWNHTFFWNSLTPAGGGALPDGTFKEAVLHTFISEEKFKEDLKTAAVSQFGSGWAWVVADQGEVKIIKTSNADAPIAHGLKPLLTIDVWEHAYYLDFQNRRPDYAQTIIDKLMNWHFAALNFQ